jgi:hypothetical protein
MYKTTQASDYHTLAVNVVSGSNRVTAVETRSKATYSL